MLPKFVPIPVPGAVDRVTDVISKNPTGVKYASPSLNCSGASLLLEEAVCCAGGGGNTAVGTGDVNTGGSIGAGGRTGVVLATSPIPACVFLGEVSICFSSLICRCWSISIFFSCSISESCAARGNASASAHTNRFII